MAEHKAVPELRLDLQSAEAAFTESKSYSDALNVQIARRDLNLAAENVRSKFEVVRG